MLCYISKISVKSLFTGVASPQNLPKLESSLGNDV